MPDLGELDYLLGNERGYGVLFGLIVRDPQTATLATVIEGGVARVASTTLGQKYDEVVVQDTSKTFTASKDTYVLLKTDGTFYYYEVANDAAKPTLTQVEAAASEGALYIAKVVTDATRITDGGVTDLRSDAPHGEFVTHEFNLSFETAEQGAAYLPLTHNGRLVAVFGSVLKALTATDAGTITAALGRNNKFTNVTGGQVSLALSSAIGTRASAFATAAKHFRSGNTLRLTSAKTTVGGKVTVTVLLEKRPK